MATRRRTRSGGFYLRASRTLLLKRTEPLSQYPLVSMDAGARLAIILINPPRQKIPRSQGLTLHHDPRLPQCSGTHQFYPSLLSMKGKSPPNHLINLTPFLHGSITLFASRIKKEVFSCAFSPRNPVRKRQRARRTN